MDGIAPHALACVRCGLQVLLPTTGRVCLVFHRLREAEFSRTSPRPLLGEGALAGGPLGDRYGTQQKQLTGHARARGQIHCGGQRTGKKWMTKGFLAVMPQRCSIGCMVSAIPRTLEVAEAASPDRNNHDIEVAAVRYATCDSARSLSEAKFCNRIHEAATAPIAHLTQ